MRLSSPAQLKCWYDGIGRRNGLKIRCQKWRVGSSPTTSTTSSKEMMARFCCLLKNTSLFHFYFSRKTLIQSYATYFCCFLWLGYKTLIVLHKGSIPLDNTKN